MSIFSALESESSLISFAGSQRKRMVRRVGRWGGGRGNNYYLKEVINQGTVILKQMRQMTKSIRTHTCSHRLVTNIHGFMLKG